MKSTRFLFLCGALALISLMIGGHNPSYAQQTPLSRVGVSVIGGGTGKNSKDGIADVAVPTLSLRERRASVGGTDISAQSGSLIIKFARLYYVNQPAIIGYTLQYFDADGRTLPNVGTTLVSLPSPLPNGAIATPPLPSAFNVGINGLQGDVSPTTAGPGGELMAVNLATKASPASVTLGPGQTTATLNFVARWSDQAYFPRNAGLQGKRSIVLTLLPDATGTIYELGDSVAVVTLEDPLPIAPIILNAIQDKQLVRGQSDLIELESTGFRSDGKPSTVFYDDNYNVITYTVQSSDQTIVTAQVVQNDGRFAGRPSLSYVAQPNAVLGSGAEVRVTANDGYGGVAADVFKVTVVSSVTSVAVDPAEVKFIVSPNPTTDHITIEAQAKVSGVARIRMTNVLGATLSMVEQPITAGRSYHQELDLTSFPEGIYFVEVSDGQVRSMQKVIKH